MQTPPNNAPHTGGTSVGASNARDELKSDISRVSDSAANRIHSEIDSRKGSAANQAKSVSSAIDRAAGELGADAPQWITSAFQQGAEQVRKFADTLERKDSREMIRDVQNLARDNPGTFLLSCAALGFAAARVVKAGGQESSEQNSPDLPSGPSPSQGDQPVFRSWNSDSARPSSPTGDF